MCACALSTVQVGVVEGHAILVHDQRCAGGAARQPKRLPGLLVLSCASQPFEVANHSTTKGIQRLGELGALHGPHGEEEAGADV